MSLAHQETRVMPLYRSLLMLLITGNALTLHQAEAQTPSLETPATPIATLHNIGVYVEGRASERFGNSFILEDASGRLLVDTWPDDNPALMLEPGDLVGVFGRPEGQRMQARWLVIDNTLVEVEQPRAAVVLGNRINRSDPVRLAEPEANSGGDAFYLQRVEAAGYQSPQAIEYKPRHLELRAINPYGESVELHLEFNGDIYKERHR